MRLLIYGHWSHTGFGVVTEALGGRLVQLGVDVRVLAMNHRGEPVKGQLAGRVWPYDILVSRIPNLSARAFDGSLWLMLDPEDEWKPDTTLVIADVSGLLNYINTDAAAWKDAHVFHYCPIEGDNLPPGWKQLWQLVEPVAMSDYGAKVMEGHIGRPVPMIYHGVDTEAFYPVSPGRPIHFDGDILREKADCRAKFEMTAERIILSTDRNVTRKNLPDLIKAFIPIAQQDPDVDLVLHCRPIDPDGPDLWQEILRMPEDVRDRVKFTMLHDTWKGLPVAGLNALYNAADVYMTATGGEGFGLTLAEALACGVPVVSTGWAAEVEVVGDGGVLIPPLHDSYGEPVRYHSKYGMDWAVPDARAFAEPVLRLLSHPGHRKGMGQLGRLHVKRSFDWDTAAAQFLDLLSVRSEAAA